MNIHPEELVKSGYVQIDRLDHMELIPFVQTYLKKVNKFTLFYKIANFLLAGILGFLVVLKINSESFTLGNALSQLSLGVALAFALIPLHEYIHVLAYRSQGAVNTSYDANLRKFYFMAVADKFIANRKEFTIVALAPFVVISALILLILPLVSLPWRLTLLAMLLVHTACCAGDFGLLSYFEFHKEKEVLTYDDKDEKVSYFFVK